MNRASPSSLPSTLKKEIGDVLLIRNVFVTPVILLYDLVIYTHIIIIIIIIIYQYMPVFFFANCIMSVINFSSVSFYFLRV